MKMDPLLILLFSATVLNGFLLIWALFSRRSVPSHVAVQSPSQKPKIIPPTPKEAGIHGILNLVDQKITPAAAAVPTKAMPVKEPPSRVDADAFFNELLDSVQKPVDKPPVAPEPKKTAPIPAPVQKIEPIIPKSAPPVPPAAPPRMPAEKPVEKQALPAAEKSKEPPAPSTTPAKKPADKPIEKVELPVTEKPKTPPAPTQPVKPYCELKSEAKAENPPAAPVKAETTMPPPPPPPAAPPEAASTPKTPSNSAPAAKPKQDDDIVDLLKKVKF